MKYRLEIKYYGNIYNSNDTILTSIKILLKNIKSVTINNYEYFRENYKNTIQVGVFYNLIKRNLENISEIKTNYYHHYIIKNNFFHNLNGPAIRILNDSILKYYIDGRLYTKENWLLKSREIKIKNILKNIQ